VDHGRHGQWIGGVTEGAVPNTIVTASDYYGRVWTINPLRELRRLARHENDIAGVTVSRDKRLLATAGSDGAVLIFDAHTYVLLRRILHHPTNESPVRAAFDGGGKTLVTGGSDGLVRLWDVASGKMTGELRDTGYISGLAVNPRRLEVAASVGKVAAIWETGAQPRRRLQLEEDSPIHVLEFDGTGTRLLSGTNDGTATLWDAETGRRLFTLQHAGRVSAAAFSRDDGVVATGGSDRTVRVWDVSRGTEIGRVSREFRVDGVAFVDDGRLIAAAGENFVQLSPWRASDLSRLACDYLGNLDGETWSRLVGNSVPPDICGR
jgi:WD40 repeat protein